MVLDWILSIRHKVVLGASSHTQQQWHTNRLVVHDTLHATEIQLNVASSKKVSSKYDAIWRKYKTCICACEKAFPQKNNHSIFWS